MLTVKVLGGGCENCARLEAEVRDALDSMDPRPEYYLVKVQDYADITAYGVMRTPALVINEQVLSSGPIPKRDQIISWAINALAAP